MNDQPATPSPTSPADTWADHATTCRQIVGELEAHYARLSRLLHLLGEAAEDAASKGRHSALAELAKVATSVQAGAARCLAGIMTVEVEGRLSAHALGRGGPRGPLIEVGGADA